MTAPYVTGTVSVTANSAVVTGNGTAWATAGIVGGLFFPDRADGNPIPILSIDGNTQLTLAFPWRGATAAGQTYGIIRDTAYLQQLSSNAQKLAEYISRLDNSALAAFAGLAGTMAADKVPYATGANAMAWATLTAFVRSLLDKTSGAGVYGALGEIPTAQLPARLRTTGVAQDPSTITETGFYAVDQSVAGMPVVNQRWMLIHQTYSSVRMIQLATLYGNNGLTYFRLWNGTAWTAWVLQTLPLLGTVSQSGGVPNGALIERGSNANGEYVRFADGTQICWGSSTPNASTAANNLYGSTAGAAVTVNDTITFPVAFVSNAYRFSVNVTFRGFAVLAGYSKSASAATSRLGVSGAAAADIPYDWIAVGRWF